MEQHPVPRNISSFQFHLIGDMTLRQFGYLIAGALCAFIVFKIVPLPVILKYPFTFLFIERKTFVDSWLSTCLWLLLIKIFDPNFISLPRIIA